MAAKEIKHKQPNLAWLILNDWLEHKVILFLIITVLSSAYAVVYFAWKNRQLNSQMQQIKDEQDQLDVNWRHMLLELNALSEHNRVEQIAIKKLDMKRPEREDERIIKSQ